jgi:hypothetical protein
MLRQHGLSFYLNCMNYYFISIFNYLNYMSKNICLCVKFIRILRNMVEFAKKKYWVGRMEDSVSGAFAGHCVQLQTSLVRVR